MFIHSVSVLHSLCCLCHFSLCGVCVHLNDSVHIIVYEDVVCVQVNVFIRDKSVFVSCTRRSENGFLINLCVFRIVLANFNTCRLRRFNT